MKASILLGLVHSEDHFLSASSSTSRQGRSRGSPYAGEIKMTKMEEATLSFNGLEKIGPVVTYFAMTVTHRGAVAFGCCANVGSMPAFPRAY